MAAELSFRHTGTGKTMKATIRKASTVGGKVQMWQTAGLPGWEDLAVANWANYILTMTETPASSYAYVGSWPAALGTAGWYVVDFYDGATIAGTLAGSFLGFWDGEGLILGATEVEAVASTVTGIMPADINLIGSDPGALVRLYDFFKDGGTPPATTADVLAQAAAALAAYDDENGVAKEASVGAVKTVVDAIAAEVTPVTPPAPIVM